LDCRNLLRAGRGQRRQGVVALNLGLDAAANEVFKSGLTEQAFPAPTSIPDKFGWRSESIESKRNRAKAFEQR
jgi:hypothetical protein